MHHQLQQRLDGLNAIRVRAHIATAEFYAMIGKEQPAQPVRFQVVAKGKHAFHIVDRTTDKVRGFRFDFARAVEYAQALEDRAAGVTVQLSSEARQ
ncbi:hypothetical protein ACIPL1_30710 [Pseudomonas sp. NPDC090202]|uniref:hypothetical protein n=1 Tax=Pseudomonas sp. NPDC090202 TaxID=3364476 RepID=UPI0037F9FA9A